MKILDFVGMFVYKHKSSINGTAGVAQLVEHRFCKPVVVGSNPITSSILGRGCRVAKGIRL